MIKENEVYLYTLANPLTNEIRYIGKTISLQKRYSRHYHDNSNNKKCSWIKSLKSKGLKPKLEVLEIVNKDEWEFWEEYWICQLRAWGVNLTNIDNGGTGKNKFTKDRLDDLRIHAKTKLFNSVKRIYGQYTFDGHLIKTFNSYEEIKKEYPGIHTGFIRKTYNNNYWVSYKLNEKVLQELSYTIDKFNKNDLNKKKVAQYNLDGMFIKQHDSIREAAIYVNKDTTSGKSNIVSVCKGRVKTAYKYIWKYVIIQGESVENELDNK